MNAAHDRRPTLAWIAQRTRRAAPRCVDRSAELGAARAAGAARRGGRVAADVARRRRTLRAVHVRGDGAVAGVRGARVAHRLHRRGRLRAVRSARDARCALWDAGARAAVERGGLPCGLAARDTLRLEAGAAALRHATWTRTTTPLEAGLGWVVKLGRATSSARARSPRKRATRPARRLVGFEHGRAGRAASRRTACFADERRGRGDVTSGTKSPTLGLVHRPGLRDAASAAMPGTPLAVEMRGERATGARRRAALLSTAQAREGRDERSGRSALHEGARVAARSKAAVGRRRHHGLRAGLRSATWCSSSCRAVGDDADRGPDLRRRRDRTRRVSDLFAPVGGAGRRGERGAAPSSRSCVNQEPYGRRMDDPHRGRRRAPWTGLLDAAAYQAHVASEQQGERVHAAHAGRHRGDAGARSACASIDASVRARARAACASARGIDLRGGSARAGAARGDGRARGAEHGAARAPSSSARGAYPHRVPAVVEPRARCARSSRPRTRRTSPR